MSRDTTRTIIYMPFFVSFIEPLWRKLGDRQTNRHTHRKRGPIIAPPPSGLGAPQGVGATRITAIDCMAPTQVNEFKFI